MDAETGLGSGDEEEVSESLLSSARSVVRTCLQIRKEEDVLVITDPETSTIGKALYEEAARVTDRVLLVMMPKTQRPGKEPPAPVSEIMRQNRVIMIATQSSLTHTRARANASKAGARIISMPGISTELFESGGMTADYNALQREMSGMGSNFRRRRKVHVTSPAGTDVTFNIGARWILEDNGICNRPGQVSNLPAGRVFVLPLEGSMSGRIVIDGSWEGSVLGGNLSFSVDGGMVTGVDGESADDVNSVFEMAKASNRGSKRDLVRTVAEFGFGLNPRATRIVGSKLEDQVVRGTAYFGFGDNTAIGGSAAVGFHIRGVMKDPSVTLDDFSLIREGKITMA